MTETEELTVNLIEMAYEPILPVLRDAINDFEIGKGSEGILKLRMLEFAMEKTTQSSQDNIQ